MLRKLLKYEFIFLIKDFSRIYIIYGIEVLILALLLSIGGTSAAHGLYTLISIFAIIYYIFTFVLALLTISHNVRRFKKNMFSHEGYLTNTLPVTPAQHVIAKVIVGAVNYVISFIVIYIGMLILFACTGHGDEFRRVMDFLFENLNRFDLVFPFFLQMATGFLALLMSCYLVSSISSMIGGSKGVSAVLAIGLVIGYTMIVSLLSSAMQGSDTSTTMYIMSLVYLIGAGIEFCAVIHIIKNNLNLQ